MVRGAAGVTTYSGGKVLILGDVNYTEIDWYNLETRRNEKTWKLKFVECVQNNFLHQPISEVTWDREADIYIYTI